MSECTRCRRLIHHSGVTPVLMATVDDRGAYAHRDTGEVARLCSVCRDEVLAFAERLPS